jgi:hypothetical protein
LLQVKGMVADLEFLMAKLAQAESPVWRREIRKKAQDLKMASQAIRVNALDPKRFKNRRSKKVKEDTAE